MKVSISEKSVRTGLREIRILRNGHMYVVGTRKKNIRAVDKLYKDFKCGTITESEYDEALELLRGNIREEF
jgi:hypothetical protein